MPDPRYSDGTWCYYCGLGNCICFDEDENLSMDPELLSLMHACPESYGYERVFNDLPTTVPCSDSEGLPLRDVSRPF